VSSFTVRINTDSAAWRDAHDAIDTWALADELERIARKLRDDGTDGPVIDTNGNVCGFFRGES
jgi:hypothetical protein